MATDIAFSLGFSLSRRKPHLAICSYFLACCRHSGRYRSDLGIAIFHTDDVIFIPLMWFAILLLAILLMQRLGVRTHAAYIPVGVLRWFALLSSVSMRRLLA
ncbi:MAG TPA: Na+/H+ antiporter NhaA [Terriglobales bacterium]|nr:Na+/H+ antiporter NhaA [Terriglobales bacterium]